MLFVKNGLAIIATIFVAYASAQSAKKGRNDVQLQMLKGKVKSVVMYSPCYSKESKVEKNCLHTLIWNFNEQGKLVSILNDGPTGKLDTSRLSVYDGNGLEVESRSVIFGRTETMHSVYDDKGNLIEYVTYDAMGRKISEARLDVHGNIVENVKFRTDGGISENGSYVYAYSFDFKGCVLTDTLFSSQRKLTMIRTYNYNDKGNMVRCMAYNGDGSKRGGDSTKYDQRGNAVEYYGLQKDGSVGARFVVRYNNYDDPIEREEYDEKGKLRGGGSMEYQYDKTGNWIKVTSFTKGKKAITTRLIQYY